MPAYAVDGAQLAKLLLKFINSRRLLTGQCVIQVDQQTRVDIGAASDAAVSATTHRFGQEESGTWRLTGVKRFITNGNADVVLVLARSDFDEEGGLGLSLFLCEAKYGIRVRRIEDKLGIHGSPTCELQFDHVPAMLIGERKRWLVTYVLALLNGARIGTAAQAVGIAQAAFNEARDFAHARQQYGRRIETIPAVADMLAEMQIQIEAARAITYEAAIAMDVTAGTLKRVATLSSPDYL